MYISYYDQNILQVKKIKKFLIEKNYIFVDGNYLLDSTQGWIHVSQLVQVSSEKI